MKSIKMCVAYFYFSMIISCAVYSQNLHKIGDTIEVVLNGYKEGKIQWQFSKDSKKWIELKNENGIKLSEIVSGPRYYRAGITNCEKTYTSDLTYIASPLNDYDYIDSIGRYLASDLLGGRKAGTHGDSLAASFIDKQFHNTGLIPLNSLTFSKSFVTRYNIPTFNIVGLIPGKDSLLKKEVIIVLAHYDHLGLSPSGYFPGADDNASGVAGLLILARRFRNNPSKRTILFLATGSEENGQQGIVAFLKSKEIPLDLIKYAFNFDQVGRLRDNILYIYGKKLNPEMETFISKINQNYLSLSFSTETYFAGSTSDHAIISNANIPAFCFTTGNHIDKHRETDTWPKINIDGILHTTTLAYKIIESLANF